MSRELEANSYMEIYESRMRLGFFFVGGIVMALGSLLTGGICAGVLLGFLGRPPTTAREFISVGSMLLIGGVGVLFFGSITIHVTDRLFGPRTPVLFLTSDGLKDVRLSSELIPWSKILSLDIYRGNSIGLEIDRQFIRTLRFSAPLVQFAMTLGRLFGCHKLTIATLPLEDMPTRKLVGIMRDRTGNFSKG